MTEKMQARCAQSRQAVFVRCCLKIAVLIAPVLLCGCGGEQAEVPSAVTAEEQPQVTETLAETEEAPFDDTTEALPDEDELSPADPLADLDITPSDYFAAGVWTSTNTDDTANFYVFDEDGIHGRIIPMADADGADFTYSISGSDMTMYVGEELTPYSASLEKTDEGHVIITMKYLGTQDELTFLAGMSAEGFTFYPAAQLAKLAEAYYTEQTGVVPAGVEYIISEDDMVVLNIWVTDENGWRSDVESYTVSMFTAAGWSSISFEDIDLSGVSLNTTEEAVNSGDDIQDIVE